MVADPEEGDGSLLLTFAFRLTWSSQRVELSNQLAGWLGVEDEALAR